VAHALTRAVEGAVAASVDALTALRHRPDLIDCIARVADCWIEALQGGGRVLFCGNGGSAADAQHLAAELVSRFAFDRPGLAAFALTTDTSVLTAIGNDYGYEHVFRRQVQAVGRPGDVLVAISTSGNSPNVLVALAEARARGLVTVGLTGMGGGRMPPLCDHCICVPAKETPRVQECHIVIGHTICQIVEEGMFGAR
jgi:D-sedoheptulose 7-phosphate isomerase